MTEYTEGITSTVYQTVTVSRSKPIIVVNRPSGMVYVHEDVWIDAGKSIDLDGDSLSFEWICQHCSGIADPHSPQLKIANPVIDQRYKLNIKVYKTVDSVEYASYKTIELTAKSFQVPNIRITEPGNMIQGIVSPNKVYRLKVEEESSVSCCLLYTSPSPRDS